MFRIKTIDTLIVNVPLKNPIKMAGVVLEYCDNTVVRITDYDGNVGWGEAPFAPLFNGETSIGMVAAIDFMKHKLLEQEILNMKDIEQKIESTIYGNHGAKSAIDMAIMDLMGKVEEKPLYEMLGGRKRDNVPMIWLIAGSSNEMELARERAEEGFVAFKVKVGTNKADVDLKRSATARKIIGDGPKVSADANQGYSPDQAIEFAREAGNIGLDFFEQPVNGFDLDSMVECNKVSTIPIGADEGLHSMSDIQKHYDLGAAQGGSLKLIKFGGTNQLMAAGNLMYSLGMNINLAGKAANTSIGSAATAHLSIALPSLQWDVSISSQYLSDDIVKSPVKVINGHIITPNDGPGLGVVVDEEKIAKYKKI
ncbi:MAG: mandelate racemase/muconate lactonizing enzyme family protein [Alphaproteobacteria bacterium]|jgi:L-alanine-DL-glutamate epimerase-like enolase superfamily enzyme|tara:strand:- start:52206 stop:53306 length:1101 start_codon:yes stop_codon:yes gene_type:complete